MDRRQFVKTAAGALVLAPTFWQLAGCSDDTTDEGGQAGASAGTNAGSGGTGAGSGAGTGAGSGSGSGAGSGTSGTGAQLEDASVKDAGEMDSAIADAGGGADAAAACLDGAKDTEITHQHKDPHSLMVPKEDVIAGAEKMYSIKGASKHDHKITLTAAHFIELAKGNSVTVTSTEDMGFDLHDHDVTVACA